MILSTDRWKKLLIVSLGLFAGTAFCMKWMEGDFWVNGEKFTILGLELFYPREKLASLLNSLDSTGQTVLGYHLYFDFAFMAGVYPGIISLCMLATQKTKTPSLIKILTFSAWLQPIAWGSDIIENLYLLRWLEDPRIGENHFLFYHLIVILKWTLALAGLGLATGVMVASWFNRRKNNF